MCRDEAVDLVAPFTKLVTRGRPWVIVKWAMSRDGKLATPPGESRWISGQESRAVVHALRGRVDAILVGSRTADLDDPMLTARPTAARSAMRIVLGSQAALSIDSQLVRTAAQVPVLVAASSAAPADNCTRLRERGVEVWQSSSAGQNVRLTELLDELGRRQFTNVLVEGGAALLRSLFEFREIDEIHVFVASRTIGGDGPTLFAGQSVEEIAAACGVDNPRIEQVGDDAYLSGRVALTQHQRRPSEA
jgi:diaminohydroxyphosphoribosylaminopyrimidine deaminase/5-amino-6-(5-phosphoribosylamino)uracil reductase